jgi:DNA repair protein RadC
VSQSELFIALFSPGCDRTNAAKITASLLKAFHSNLISILTASIEELTHVEGINVEKACQIKVAFELAKRAFSYRKEERPLITSTEDVVMLTAPHMMYLKQEEFRVLLLDSKNRVIRSETVSKGSLDTTVVHPREVFRPAIAAAAASIILVHNHPSGDPSPSEQDLLLTRELCLCGRIIGIDVVDHVIIGFLDFVSMKHRNLM